MKKYHLLDYDHNSLAVKQDRVYRTASQIVLKYGAVGVARLGYTDERIREFWEYDDDIPSPKYFERRIKYPNVKWYIHNKIKPNYPIWSADFLHGLISHCKIRWNRRSFPSCEWCNNKDITTLLQVSPFGGKMFMPENNARHRWMNVPALCLKFDDTTVSFAAGLMAGLKKVERNGTSYAMFYQKALPYFKKMGIPIEGECGQGAYLISPFWPALFIDHMPLGLYQKWMEVKRPCNADIYAAILWKTYVGNDFVTDGIPYLQSRRTIYYEFECEEGAMKKLEKMRVEKNLTELDSRVKTVVQEWSINKNEVN